MRVKTQRFRQNTEFGHHDIEVEGNELRVKRSSDGWWIRFTLTDDLRAFLKSF